MAHFLFGFSFKTNQFQQDPVIFGEERNSHNRINLPLIFLYTKNIPAFIYWEDWFDNTSLAEAASLLLTTNPKRESTAAHYFHSLFGSGPISNTSFDPLISSL